MRQLPRKPSESQRKIISATADYFGLPDTVKEQNHIRQSIVKIALWLMGRRVRNELSDGEKEVMNMVKMNLEDKEYMKSFENGSEYTVFAQLYGL